ncbi:MAG: FecR domain-containing protein [Clostridium sp.]|nr:FecR domain-containing protein [Clostridium sp.]
MEKEPRHINPNVSEDAVERFLEIAELPPVDPERVKQLTRAKIARENMRIKRHHRAAWMSALSAAACVAIIVGFFIWRDAESPSEAASRMLASNELSTEDYLQFSVPVGQTSTLILADGTKVIANSRSTVRYPQQFTGGVRHVYAEGEVYFEVAKDADHPFVVQSKGFDLQVLGTTFCINTFDSLATSVVLVEGSVAVSSGDGEERVKLKPGQKAEIEDGFIASVTKVNTEFYTSWTRGVLTLDGQTLGDIARHLSDHYGVDINIDPGLWDSRLYGSLELKSDIDGVLITLSNILPMDVEASPDSTAYNLTATK